MTAYLRGISRLSGASFSLGSSGDTSVTVAESSKSESRAKMAHDQDESTIFSCYSIRDCGRYRLP
jgi:hypothetical protein